jgi:hypothetical protein
VFKINEAHSDEERNSNALSAVLSKHSKTIGHLISPLVVIVIVSQWFFFVDWYLMGVT